MNQRTDPKALVASGLAISADVPTRQDLLRTIARTFELQGKKTFFAIPEVEYKADNVIRAFEAVKGNVLQPIVAALNSANVPTEPTLGSIMDNTGLLKAEVHDLVCECKGAEVTGITMAKRFNDLADRG